MTRPEVQDESKPDGLQNPKGALIIDAIEDLTAITSRRKSTGEALGEVRSLSGPAGFETLRLHYEVLPPGRRTAPAHAHSNREEAVIVIQGSVVVRVGENEHTVEAGGAACLLPGDTPHEIRNCAQDDAILWVASAVSVPDTVVFEDAPARIN